MNFHNTSINNQPTTLDAIYKGIYSEMVCMQAFADKQTAVKQMMLKTSEQLVATYKSALKVMTAKKSIFTNSTINFTVEQLLLVRGVGMVKAQAILAFIKEFAVTKIEQLAHVKGVGKVLLNTLMNHKF